MKIDNFNLSQHIMISDLKEKRDQLCEKVEEVIRSTNEDVLRNWSEMMKIEAELSDLKMKKVLMRFRLKECYLTILKNPDETM